MVTIPRDVQHRQRNSSATAAAVWGTCSLMPGTAELPNGLFYLKLKKKNKKIHYKKIYFSPLLFTDQTNSGNYRRGSKIDSSQGNLSANGDCHRRFHVGAFT